MMDTVWSRARITAEIRFFLVTVPSQLFRTPFPSPFLAVLKRETSLSALKRRTNKTLNYL
jgi:hypothetical protein